MSSLIIRLFEILLMLISIVTTLINYWTLSKCFKFVKNSGQLPGPKIIACWMKRGEVCLLAVQLIMLTMAVDRAFRLAVPDVNRYTLYAIARTLVCILVAWCALKARQDYLSIFNISKRLVKGQDT